MFTLEIATGGAAFGDDPHYEIARILRTVSYRVEEGERSGKIRDSNGNTVGKFKVT